MEWLHLLLLFWGFFSLHLWAGLSKLQLKDRRKYDNLTILYILIGPLFWPILLNIYYEAEALEKQNIIEFIKESF